ncbi:MAG: FHA domain-containing protein [Deltaproteobacteria bacterium]
MFKLVIQDDEGKTTVVPLIRDEITIGRKEGNTIRLTERNVSRRHARILRSNNEVQIEDLGSYNGIRVNNARIAERVSLRISDQVQIGDYKLYLKAEGVEQVDDARTMPIERIENVGATEDMAAVSPTANTPTAPIPVTPSPVSRALGVADTDPSARPVATPAQVAALTAVTGYGKLVVLSSNFAGKEFELTRPQMIVGRTDENDLVVNHRSISRNHAKITRDTDTQRYTISDLQSSNGVRVNGQDYGKVELRRGDVVDLGHVRLRFVEPGEDFVFARDAQIADVEGTGGKRGAMIAIVLAVVVLGAVAAYFALKSNNPPGDKNGGGVGSSGSDVLAVGSGGSGSAVAMIPDTIDATPAVPPTGDDAKRVAAECQSAVVERNWSSVNVCADKLAQYDATAANDFKVRARAEVKNDQTKAKIDTAIGEGNLVSAKKLLGDIPEASVYKKDAETEVGNLEDKILDDAKTRAAANKAANKCKDNDILIKQTSDKTPKAAKVLEPYKCTVASVQPPEDCTSILRNPESKACRNQFCNKNPDNAKCVSAVASPACNADDLQNAGIAATARGDNLVALQQYDAALRCKWDAHTLSLSFMAACRAQKVEFARKYWKKMSSEMKTHYLQMCLHEHITQDQLDQ